MKSMKRLGRVAVIALMAMLAASSCDFFFGHHKSKSAPGAPTAPAQVGPSGSVVVYLGTPASRTVRPVFPSITSYDLRLERPNYAPILLSGQSGAQVTFPSVPIGTWTVTAEGYAGTTIVARGATTVVVTEATAAQVSLTLRYFQDSGTGDVDLVLRFPDSVGITGVEATFALFGSPASAPIVLTIVDDAGLLSSVHYAQAGLASGSYDVRFSFLAGATKYLTYIEAVQVWGALASSADITLADTDFRTPPPVPATFAAADTEARTIQLTWDPAAVRTETGFILQRSTSALFNENLVEYAVAANAASYVDTTLDVDVPYHYRLASVNDYGQSGWAALAGTATATNVYVGNCTIYDDSAYQSFGNAQYWKITGNLDIRNVGGDLAELSSLREVDGFLFIYSTGLTSLNGLQNLSSVGGYLDISYNGSLLDMDALSALGSVGAYCAIYQNAALASISLPAIATIGGTFEIGWCGNLASISIAAQSIGGSVGIGAWDYGYAWNWVGDIGSLAGVSFPNLQSIGGRLWISGINATATLSCPALATVGTNPDDDWIYIYNNAGIGALSFPALTGGQGILVSSNAGLASVSAPLLGSLARGIGFQTNANLVSVSLPVLASLGGYLGVYDNAAFTSLDIAALTTIGGDLDIGLNSGYGAYPNPAFNVGNSLSHVQTVGGSVRIGNNQATSFTSLDLSALTSVGGELCIINNDSLVSFAAPLLVSMNGLRVYDDAALTSIQLPALTGTVSGNVYVWDNPALVAITHAGAGTFAVTGEVLIGTYDGYGNWDSHWGEHHNALLDDVSALAKITSIGGTLQVCFSDALQQVAMTNLASVGGDLRVQHNASLFGFTANAVTSVGANLVFEDGPMFGSLSVGTGGFTVGGDLCLSACQRLRNINGVRTVTSVGGTLWLRLMGDNIGYAMIELLNGGNTITAPMGGLRIDECNYMTTLTGLTISGASTGTVYIGGNDTLQNLAGIALPSSLTGDLRIVDNSQLASVSSLSNIGSIGGTLRIQGNPVLTSLPLTSLTQVGANLEIVNTGLSGIVGLGGLTQVTGSVSISGNAVLGSIDGLSHVATVGGSIDIVNNGNLTAIQGGSGKGLNALATLGGYLNVETNVNLGELALPALTATGSYFRVYNDDQLAVLSAPLLTTTAGDLSVYDNAVLADLTGLATVQSVGAELHVRDNPEMTTLFGAASALTNVGAGGDSAVDYWGWTGVAESIYVQNCPKLEDLSGLDGVSAVAGTLWLGALPELSSIADLSNLTTIGGWLVVYDCGDGAQTVGLNLTTLPFTNLGSVTGEMRIYENGSLTSLGMPSLTAIGGAARVVNNAALPEVDVYAWLATRTHGGEEVSGNFNP